MSGNDSAYSDLVLEHFEQPKNVGSLSAASDVISGQAGQRDHGAEFRLTARIERGAISEARFEAYGCPHCIAAGSLLTTRLVGMRREELERWSWREAAQVLQVPTAKRGRLLILEDAVRALAEDWRRRF
jgi:nitrogen fixation protein NifU and related proteins